MLPQQNSDPRPFDLEENAIMVVGGEDGKLDEDDYILFYAQGADEYHYDTSQGLFQFEKNIYDTANFYFLTIGEEPGLRISDQPDLGEGHEPITTYTDFYFYEKDESNLLHSGREWWGRLNSEGIKEMEIPFNTLDPQGVTKAYVEVMSQTTRSTKYTFSLNDNEIGQLTTDTIRNFNNPSYEYTVRGKEASGTFQILNSHLSSQPVEFKIQFHKKSDNNDNISQGYFNKAIIQSDRKLVYDNSPLLFHATKIQEHGLVTINIEKAREGLQLWEITEASRPANQNYQLQGTTLLSGTVGGYIKKLILFDPSTLPAPEFIKKTDNQNLKSLQTPELLIITNPTFIDEAQRLADFRSINDGYSVATVTTEHIYNEFSSGRQDITAIRDFIRHLYNKNSGDLKYILLVGKGSYDYLDRERANTNYIPIYQSRNSLHPVSTYSSDDYYGFLEEDEGQWEENSNGDHTLDVGIGRLPVTTTGELKNVVDKLIHYSSSSESMGGWRSNMIFVADDGDQNIYQQQSERLSVFADTSLSYFTFNKLFLGNYEQVKANTIEKSPAGRKAVKDALEKGALLVNYIGHGGHLQWADEEILNNEVIDNLTNFDKLPLFVTATCEFGRHDDPLYRSGGERLVLNPKGGGIGLVTTSRPVYSSSNFEINKAFFNALMGSMPTGVLGDIFKETKNMALEGSDNRNFILLGDPSMPLAIPQYKISLENKVTDTLKAQQLVELKGKITDESDNRQYNFNGDVEITIFDKPFNLQTREDSDNAPFSYSDRKSVVFRGKATVENGEFSSNFIVPVDIQYKVGDGKINLYARENEGLREAALGQNIKIGGSASRSISDNDGPAITAWLGDETFQNGDFIGGDVLLVAKFDDPAGINLSSRSLDGDITAYVDGKYIVLNDYYTSNIDDFTSGTLAYPLEGLNPGKHTLILSASDVFGNISSIELEFVVSDNKGLVLEELVNYPNPVRSNTTFIFKHNRTGEPLEGTFAIYSSRGENILTFDFETPVGQVRHKIFEWDTKTINQSKVGEGIYYYKVSVRSKLDGAQAEKIQKLIIIN